MLERHQNKADKNHGNYALGNPKTRIRQSGSRDRQAVEGDANILQDRKKGIEKLPETVIKERNGVKLIKSQFICGNTGNHPPVILDPEFTVVSTRQPTPLYRGNNQTVADKAFEKAAAS
jgi:hypothetical protein